MPFRSKAQRSYLNANNPSVAAKFEAATPPGTKLPAELKAKAKHHPVKNANAKPDKLTPGDTADVAKAKQAAAKRRAVKAPAKHK